MIAMMEMIEHVLCIFPNIPITGIVCVFVILYLHFISHIRIRLFQHTGLVTASLVVFNSAHLVTNSDQKLHACDIQFFIRMKSIFELIWSSSRHRLFANSYFLIVQEILNKMYIVYLWFRKHDL